MERDGLGAFSVMLAFLVLLALFIAAPAKAEVRAGLGVNCGNLVGDGYWVQEGLPYQMTECQTVFSLQYIGRTRTKWLDYGIGLAYRKGPKTKGEYVSDECYGARQFSGGGTIVIGTTTMGACDRRWHLANTEIRTRAITITLNPTMRINSRLSFSTGIGASLHHTSTSVSWDHTKGVCAISQCDDAVFKKTGLSPYLELTAKYGDVFLTAYNAPMERDGDAAGAANGNRGIIGGYVFNF